MSQQCTAVANDYQFASQCDVRYPLESLMPYLVKGFTVYWSPFPPFIVKTMKTTLLNVNSQTSQVWDFYIEDTFLWDFLHIQLWMCRNQDRAFPFLSFFFFFLQISLFREHKRENEEMLSILFTSFHFIFCFNCFLNILLWVLFLQFFIKSSNFKIKTTINFLINVKLIICWRIS